MMMGAIQAAALGKQPVLFYIYAEPGSRAGVPIPQAQITLHRDEIKAFARAVAGDKVEFASSNYQTWFLGWKDAGVAKHAETLRRAFDV